MGTARVPDNEHDDSDAPAGPEVGAAPPLMRAPVDGEEPPPEPVPGAAPALAPVRPDEVTPESVVPHPATDEAEAGLATPSATVPVENPAGMLEGGPANTAIAPSDAATPLVAPDDETSSQVMNSVPTAMGSDRGEAPVAGADLEESVLPSAIQAPTPLSVGTVLGAEGAVRIEQFLDTHGRLNRYGATVRQGEGAPILCELREVPAEHADLRRESEVLADVRYAMLPQLIAAFEQGGRRYLAVERREVRGTLAETLETGLDVARAISVVLQLTQVLRRLHAAGWALLGLQPSHVVLDDPLVITRLGTAARIGQETAGTLSIAGYSAPELAHRAVVTGKEDVYTLGALLYRVLVGIPVPEQGPELAALGALVRLPGAPQLLDTALAPIEERADLETFYHRLLAFKEQLSRRVFALEVAGGTTVGLNRSRPVNEDAHAYSTWSLAHHERVAFRALLCVVDGMGGMEAGEVASQAAMRAVLDAVSGESAFAAPPPEPVALVRMAARAVYDAAQGRAVGATITCMVVDDGAVTLAHVGDTRAYLLRDGALAQLTHDHSLVAAMVSSGVLTKEEAHGHPDSNKVLRSLGGQRELEDAYIDTLTATRGAETLHLREADRLLLCSDGVWGVLDDGVLSDLLGDTESCAAVVQTILQRVLDGGAPDNATLIVARCTAMSAN